jgi:hypothetical protein
VGREYIKIMAKHVDDDSSEFGGSRGVCHEQMCSADGLIVEYRERL